MNFSDAIEKQIDADKQRCIEHGWQFRDRTVFSHTAGDLIAAIMAVSTEAEAQEFYESYVAWLEGQPDRKEPSQHVADVNIRWCFGEGMSEERKQMWMKCTNASHPIFGRESPTPQEAYRLGLTRGRRG